MRTVAALKLFRLGSLVPIYYLSSESMDLNIVSVPSCSFHDDSL